MVEETLSPLKVTSFVVVTNLVFSQSCELALAAGRPGPAGCDRLGGLATQLSSC